jgi:hypothetical protein
MNTATVRIAAPMTSTQSVSAGDAALVSAPLAR